MGSTTTGPGIGYTSRVITTPGGNILEDKVVTAVGSYAATAPVSPSSQWVAQMVAFRQAANAAPVVSAGPNQTLTFPTNSTSLNGTVTDDGLPNNVLTISWSKVSGPGTVTFGSSTAQVTTATFSAVGTYVLQLTANDSQLSSSSTTTVVVNSEPIVLTLAPSTSGPNVTGTTQAMMATATGLNGAPKSGLTVQFTVTGANPSTGSVATNSSGQASFTYTGANSGTDTIHASNGTYTSNTASVGWVTPVQNASLGTIFGRFFLPSSGNTITLTPTSTPVFTMAFPNIDFDPPAGTIPGNTSGVDINTRPFTNITTDINGNFTGTIVAQGNGYQAGVGQLSSFQAEFTGTFVVAHAGNVTVKFFTDDGIFFGVGGGATYVSGVMVNPPPSGKTVFESLPLMAAYNNNTNPPLATTVVFNVPAPGTYPFEIDYEECCAGSLALNMTIGQSTSSGLPPAGQLSITPLNPSSIPTGQTETLTVKAVDAAGQSVAGLGVALLINGVNTQQLSATTDSSGNATFLYVGNNAGTDVVQAIADITGMAAYSNIVKVPWTATGSGITYIFTPQGWIGSPSIGAIVQGQIPITLASGVTLTSGKLQYFPTSNPANITILNANTTGTGPLTLGTFDSTLLANGEYTIQLQASTSTGANQLNEIVVSVTGENKPGRETVTVTDFKVPLAGIPINITRTYDSLNRGTVEDFGYGWKLGAGVELSVDKLMNVTFTLDGKRETFYFTPQSTGSAFFSWLLVPNYTPQPGVHGTLTSNGCGALIQVGGTLVQDTVGVSCFPAGNYQPSVYTYTDPVGRVYTMSSAGQLQTIKDLNGNTLTFAANGINSSVNGIVVPFIRDGQGRIQKITDLAQKDYTYTYDGNGNLQFVQYPGLANPTTYGYFPDHSLQSRIEPLGNSTTMTYYPDGRLQSVTSPSVSDANGNPVNHVAQYTYTVSTNTTTTTNSDNGAITASVTRTDDNFGKPLSITEQVNATTSRKTTYQYDASENLIHMTDACGNGTCSDMIGTNHVYTYTYDANGFQTSVQDPLGNTSRKFYNQFGEVTSATDAANTNTQTFTYDANFNLQQVTDLLNGSGTLVSSYTYDAQGNILTSTDANNKTSQYSHDANGNLFQVTDALNEITYFGYDAMDRVTSKTDPMMGVTQFTYDALGRLKTKTDPLSNVTQYFYDDNGNKTREIDANNHKTDYQYDNLNRLVKITYDDLTTRQYRYDFRGNKVVEIDQLGHQTNYSYDLAGQVTDITYAAGTPDAGTVHYTYDLDGRVSTFQDELGNTTRNTYDVAGNLKTVQDALLNSTNYGYDADNRKASMQDANLNTTGYSYDPRGRLSTITYPIVPPATTATTTQYTYDGVGRVRTTTDQAGNATTNTYDDVGRLSTVQDAVTNITHYFYDLNGNLTSVQDAAGRITSYQYDDLNRRTVRTLPLHQQEFYTYDPVGNLATKIDFNGKKTTYHYNTLNRLLSKIPDPSLGQPTVSYTYTATGQRLSMIDASGTTNYPTYDNRDRLRTKITPEGTLTYTYDAHGNVKTIASSNVNGASVSYQYDLLNRLSQATDNRLLAQGASSATTTYRYDAAGNLLNYTYPNGVVTGNLFDPLNRLTQTCAALTTPPCSAGTKLASFAYTLGAAGNRTGVAELNGRSVNYGYDNDYRLTSEAITSDPGGNNGNVGYPNYDPVGNRIQRTSTLSAVPAGSFSYDANDRLTTDTYDNNGNTIASGGISNTYDFENRMLSHGGVTLGYDGDGNRVSETVSGTTTKYLIDNLNPTGLSQVMDEIVSGSVIRTYAYGLQRISENQIAGSTWVPSFYGYDGHGNTRFVTNSSGTVTDTYQYDAFGNKIASTGPTANPYLYSGERFDSALNLYYLRARDFNMLTGRFETMDLFSGNVNDPATLHKYVYTRNNPVNRLDPTGLADEEEYQADLGVLRNFANRWRADKVVQFQACMASVEMYLIINGLYMTESWETIMEIQSIAEERCRAAVWGLN